MRILFVSLFLLLLGSFATQPVNAQTYVLQPDRIFDGERFQTNVEVRIEDGLITEIGERVNRSDAELIDLSGATLTPGLIDAHSHVLLHPYDETSWTDQVLKESTAERAIRAANHLEATLMAGFTTLRDLGSEGAGYADVGVRQALEKGVIDGPRLLVAGPAIVATGSYGPAGFHEGVKVPLGAHEADGHDDLIREVRAQIGGGADWIKVYADYRWGPNGQARPTFSETELALIVETAAAAGRSVVAHASTDEAMQRAVRAGVKTIEHGDHGTLATYQLMATKGVAICPTLGAVEAISRYRGWDGKPETVPERIKIKRTQMQHILEAGTSLCNGSDVGVFDHGDNAWEIELMVAYGVQLVDALHAATAGNADLLRLDGLGRIAPGQIADLAAFSGDISHNLQALRHPVLVIKSGEIKHRF